MDRNIKNPHDPAVLSHDSPDMYRIGDYARYMGVTPDLLKHYEQFGLIRSVTRSSGYRYYHFSESSRLLECMGLRNVGFSLRECGPLLNEADEGTQLEAYRQQAETLEKEILYRQEMLTFCHQMEAAAEKMQNRDTRWWIDDCEPMLFLPHTNLRTFVDDPRIYTLLPHWIHWMPIVRSAVSILPDRPADPDQPDWRTGCSWGLLADQSFAERVGLLLNDVVRHVPARKTLFMQYRNNAVSIGTSESDYARLWRLLDSLSLTPAGPILRACIQRSVKDGKRTASGCYMVPLEE